MISRRPEYVDYSDADLESMNPLYAAYVAAKGMRVQKGRDDLFSAWIQERRLEFRADEAARSSSEEFRDWILRRHPWRAAGPGS